MTPKLVQKLAQQRTEQNGNDADIELTQNAEVDAKIDNYIKKNPDYLSKYVQKLPRERLERVVVLRKVEQVELREQRAAWRQKNREARVPKLEKWLSDHPDEAKRIEQSLARVPEDKKQGARINMIRDAIVDGATNARQAQSAPAARMAV